MKLRSVERHESEDSPNYVFWCPGCKCGHGVWTDHPNKGSGATWSFNGNMEKPTFTPSLKIDSAKTPPADPATGDFKKGPDGKYLIGSDGRPEGCLDQCCHSVITDGVIHFCADCTHELVGQSVPMEDF